MDLQQIAKNRSDYKEYLKGKRVVVVGPAPSVLGSKQRDLIESYDVVVRLNRALPIPDKLKDDIGERTDVLYNCMNPSEECGGKIDVNLLNNLGVKFLVSPYAPLKDRFRFKKDITAYWKANGNAVPFCFINPAYFSKLLEIMKLPNTGINAILDLLRHDISELYITGFTFFKGGYIKEYRRYNEKQVMDRMAKYNLHDQEKQLEYMKKVLTKDNRVKMDKALHEIIHSKSVSFIGGKTSNAATGNSRLGFGTRSKTAVSRGRRKIQRKYASNSSLKLR